MSIHRSNINLAILPINKQPHCPEEWDYTSPPSSSPKAGDNPLVLSCLLPRFSFPQAARIAEEARHNFIAVSNKHIW